MRTLLTTLALLIALSGLSFAQEREEQPGIQLAILLDTSGSMEGLINQARIELWRIVNELVAARRGEVLPNLQIALYEYGNSGLPQGEGYIRQCVPLTDDLDLVSQQLFGLTTNGGDEHCGQVIQRAVRNLAWSADPATLKMIYISGNETFAQGPVDFRAALVEAVSADIIVNTIHCAGGEDTFWAEAATLGEGSFLGIDQNQAVGHIESPFDEELAALSGRLNETYLAYGEEEERAARELLQSDQDDNARRAGSGASTERAFAKASKLYDNSAWDLGDAVRGGLVSLDSIDVALLPEPMRDMTPDERQAFLDEQLREREQIQARIQELYEARQAFVDEKMRALGDESTLGAVLLESLRERAVEKGYSFDD